MVRERGRRKVRIGIVLSDRMAKTRVVGVEWSKPHPLYGRRVRRITRFKAHDEENLTRQGDRVRIMETRRLSAGKRWRVVEVMERAEVVEIRPEEVDTTLLQELSGQRQAAAEAEAPVAEEAAPVETEVAEEAPVAEKPKAKTRATGTKRTPRAKAQAAEEAEAPAAEEAAPVEAEVAEEAPVAEKPKAKTRATGTKRTPRAKAQAAEEAEAPAAEEAAPVEAEVAEEATGAKRTPRAKPQAIVAEEQPEESVEPEEERENLR